VHAARRRASAAHTCPRIACSPSRSPGGNGRSGCGDLRSDERKRHGYYDILKAGSHLCLEIAPNVGRPREIASHPNRPDEGTDRNSHDVSGTGDQHKRGRLQRQHQRE
jgi:hypothetical protein